MRERGSTAKNLPPSRHATHIILLGEAASFHVLQAIIGECQDIVEWASAHFGVGTLKQGLHGNRESRETSPNQLV